MEVTYIGPDLLQDPVVGVVTVDGRQGKKSLPGVYQALMGDQVQAFPALRPHQRHPWHAFLAQLGAMALHRAGKDEPPAGEGEWRQYIGDLTSDWPDGEPWRLIVEDITRPAFMQPPARSHAAASEYKRTLPTPDSVDLLVTSRNHEIKRQVATSPAHDDWVFALIALQTMSGYPGRGNYGISRMNGGNGSRPAFSLTPSTRPGPHLRRDIAALLEKRDELLGDYPMRSGGTALLWTIPWEGRKNEYVTLDALDPFYIEICRRVRLRTGKAGNVYAARATSASTRIGPKKAMEATKGIVGDPWTPTNAKQRKSLTLSSLGFTYQKTADYIFSAEWKEAPLFLTDSERADPQPMFLVARGIAGGQGKTSGYHERIVPFKRHTVATCARPRGIEHLGDISRERIGQVRQIQKILRHAIAVYSANGDTDALKKSHFDLGDPWAGKLNDMVDVGFFEDIQDEHAAETHGERKGIRYRWLGSVISDARSLTAQAYQSVPVTASRGYRARVRAENVFEGRLRAGFPELFDRKEPQ